MIKGAQKRIVVVKNTDSRLFSEAHFILKDGLQKPSDKDVISEAKRIIAECVSENEKGMPALAASRNTSRSKDGAPLRVLVGFLLFTLGAAVGCGTAVFLLI